MQCLREVIYYSGIYAITRNHLTGWVVSGFKKLCVCLQWLHIFCWFRLFISLHISYLHSVRLAPTGRQSQSSLGQFFFLLPINTAMYPWTGLDCYSIPRTQETHCHTVGLLWRIYLYFTDSFDKLRRIITLPYHTYGPSQSQL